MPERISRKFDRGMSQVVVHVRVEPRIGRAWTGLLGILVPLSTQPTVSATSLFIT